MSNIVLKQLSFSNMFSYGENNVVDLSKNSINQFIAENGAGKTSIALILQELLFSKNVKGFKKGDILNRYIKAKTWKGSIFFTVDKVEYLLRVERTGASSKVMLLKEGVDISEHKLADTYKKVEDLLKMDFDTFSQLTYKSSTDSLEFLTATDTIRKRFLIKLFNLEKYTSIADKVKLQESSKDKELTKLKSELAGLLSRTIGDIPDKLFPKPEIAVDNSISENLAEAKVLLRDIESKNAAIKANQNLLFEIANLNIKEIKEPEPFDTDKLQTLKFDLTQLQTTISKKTQELNSIKLNDKCSACGQTINNDHLKEIKAKLTSEIEKLNADYQQYLPVYKQLNNEFTEYSARKKEYENNKTDLNKLNALKAKYDPNLPTEFYDANSIKSSIKTLSELRDKNEAEIIEVSKYNQYVAAHNAKVDTLTEEKEKITVRQKELESAILKTSDELSHWGVLKKAFSPTGLIAYKLESLTKELEQSINTYLAELSDGQFQLEFVLDNDKLNIDIYNQGIVSAIETVSNGELHRIQTAVLLSIRKMLSELGGSSINLLFLDEVMGVLDTKGKESFIEILAREGLNVFLISHEYTNPLINKIYIEKTDNISTIR